MRTYGQFCAAARALDVIGDRWSLLIVRELLARPCRYTDLRAGLPGITSNLLAERLRQLESDAVIEREAATPPVATAVYRLTDRGRALHRVIRELGRWGAPVLDASSQDAVFQAHWLALPLDVLLADRTDLPEAIVQINTGELPLVLHTGPAGATVTAGRATDPRLTITTQEPRNILPLFTGRIAPGNATDHGVELTGDIAVLDQLVTAGNR